jgi:type I restriction enzyme, S subunit
MEQERRNPEIRFSGFTDDWVTTEVGSYYVFKNGLNKGKEYFGHGKPIVNFTDVFHKRGIYQNQLKGRVDVTVEEIKNYNVIKGDIFFTRTSETIEEIGLPSVMLDKPQDAVFSGFVLRARAKDLDPLDISFKKYAFSTDSFRSEMVKKSSMTTRALTSGTAIKKMLFSFPESKEEQRQIGNYITELEHLIEQHQQKNMKLTTLKKAMLKKMFPQEGSDVPEIRFKGFEDVWEQIKLGEIGKTFTGLSGKTKEDFGHGTGRFVTYMNVFSNPISNPSMIDPIEVDSSQNTIMAGDVLFTTSSETPEEVGMSSVWLETMDNVYLNSFCFGYRPEKEIDSHYLAIVLRSPVLRKRISFLAQGISRYNISKNKVMGIAIPLPIKEEQEKIGTYFQNLDNLINQHLFQLDKLKNIKKACLEKMFV